MTVSECASSLNPALRVRRRNRPATVHDLDDGTLLSIFRLVPRSVLALREGELLCRPGIEAACVRWRRLALTLPTALRIHCQLPTESDDESDEEEARWPAVTDVLPSHCIGELTLATEADSNGWGPTPPGRRTLPLLCKRLPLGALTRLSCSPALAAQLLPSCSGLAELELVLWDADHYKPSSLDGYHHSWGQLCRDAAPALAVAPPSLQRLRIAASGPGMYWKLAPLLAGLRLDKPVLELSRPAWQRLLAEPAERGANRATQRGAERADEQAAERAAREAHCAALLGRLRQARFYAATPRRLATPLPGATQLGRLEQLAVKVSTVVWEAGSEADSESDLEWGEDFDDDDDSVCTDGDPKMRDAKELRAPWLRRLPALRSLSFQAEESPYLSVLPDCWGLSRLTELEVATDWLQRPTAAELDLPQLQRLTLRCYFPDEALPDVFCALPALTRLVFEELRGPFEHRFRLPEVATQLTRLEEVWLQLSSRAQAGGPGLHPGSLKCLHRLTRLRCLSLCDCQLDAPPVGLLPLAGLTHLDLSGNDFAFPTRIAGPPMLEWLAGAKSLQALTLGTVDPSEEASGWEWEVEPQASLSDLPSLRLITLMHWPLSGWPPRSFADEMEDWHDWVMTALQDAGADPAVRYLWASRTPGRQREAQQECALAHLPFAGPLGDSF